MRYSLFWLTFKNTSNTWKPGVCIFKYYRLDVKTVIFKRKRKIQSEIKKLMKAISVSPKTPPGNLCEKSMLFCWEH